MFPINTRSLTVDTGLFRAERHSNVVCPLHLHYSMEIVFVNHGEIVMNVNGSDRRIKAGEATLILPFEQHSFATPSASECFVIEFSPEKTLEFYDEVKGKSLVTEVFSPSIDTAKLCDRILPNIFLNELNSKAVLYPLCLDILAKCEFCESGKVPDKIFIEAIKYIQQNYESNNVTLKATAKALGVHNVYLSRVFSQNADISFTAYVNLIRCTAAAEKIRKDAEATLSEIAFSCGFGSIRSFNREFLSTFGITPKEYRNRYRKENQK